ncbi:putative RNA 3'-terminal phosphate cyclase-like [Apostichopus japonicus]|uniref:RNA 3'-terminal phosphate cyclase n=1 Tax=Stichopus japonicus TaxID=307972 RepID=A0A2G8KA48_STIJA|nr:putative RNA 3'-terminal phosphate cyclase-like [Apostichopus japonicus]
MASRLPLVIDGSVLEGGGQILRMSTAFSCLTAQPITVNKIRLGRSKPGLRPQHLTGFQMMAEICKGEIRGDAVGSTEITLTPHPSRKEPLEQTQEMDHILRSTEYKKSKKVNRITTKKNVDELHTWSVALLLQVSLPCTLYAPGPIDMTFIGGTNAEMAPQIDYITLRLTILREEPVVINTQPLKQLQPITMTEPGQVTKITGMAFVAGVLPFHIAKRMARSATDIIRMEFPNIDVRIEPKQERREDAVGTGSGIVIVAETSTGCLFAGSALGKKGVQAEEVGRSATESLVQSLSDGGCVDEHLQDQLIIFMALADGVSRVLSGPLTMHTKTAIYTAELLTEAKFKVTPVGGNSRCELIECTGIGLKNNSL